MSERCPSRYTLGELPGDSAPLWRPDWRACVVGPEPHRLHRDRLHHTWTDDDEETA